MLIPKTYPLLQQAIEDGVRYGYRKAHKHTEDPTEKELCDAIEGAVMFQIAETFSIVDRDDDYRN
jgi:hypothetical protein